jgi:hypothetical protein
MPSWRLVLLEVWNTVPWLIKLDAELHFGITQVMLSDLMFHSMVLITMVTIQWIWLMLFQLSESLHCVDQSMVELKSTFMVLVWTLLFLRRLQLLSNSELLTHNKSTNPISMKFNTLMMITMMSFISQTNSLRLPRPTTQILMINKLLKNMLVPSLQILQSISITIHQMLEVKEVLFQS